MGEWLQDENEDGNLVFEIVCYFTVTQEDAKKSCPESYKNKVVLPTVGTRVEMHGAFVRDDSYLSVSFFLRDSHDSARFSPEDVIWGG